MNDEGLSQLGSAKETSCTKVAEPVEPQWPDFMGRLKQIYGNRVGKDSQETIDYLREERC